MSDEKHENEEMDQAIRALAECIVRDPTEQLGSMTLNTLVRTLVTMSGAVVRNVQDKGRYTLSQKSLSAPTTRAEADVKKIIGLN